MLTKHAAIFLSGVYVALGFLLGKLSWLLSATNHWEDVVAVMVRPAEHRLEPVSKKGIGEAAAQGTLSV